MDLDLDFISPRENISFNRDGLDSLDNFNKFMGNLKECSLCEKKLEYYDSNVIKYYLMRSKDEPNELSELEYYDSNVIELYLMRSNDEPKNELFDDKEFAEYFLGMCSVKDKDFYVCCDKCDGWELVDQETHDSLKNDDTPFYCIKCAIKVPPTISPTNITSKKKAAKSHNRLKKKWTKKVV